MAITNTSPAGSSALTICSPVAPSRINERPLADRLDRKGSETSTGPEISIGEVRIGLLDNQKANAGLLLDEVGRQLAARHTGITLVTEKKIATSASPPQVMERMRTYDAVVLAIAD